MRAADRIQYAKREGKISYKHNNMKLTNLEGVVSEMSKIAVTSLGLSFLICDMVLVGRKNRTNSVLVI